jgi:hypothetical protein
VTGTLVLLAYHYPPLVGPASERAASFARHLPGLGWETTVVTARSARYHRSAGHEGPPVRTVRTRSPEPGRLLARVRPSEEAGAPVLAGHGLAERARRLVRDYVYVPDAQAPWIPFAAHAARREAERAERPVLMSTSVPYSAHLAAMRAARRTGAPWMAELRDPWALTGEDVRPRSRLRRRIDWGMEARVVAAATGVVVTSERTREDMLRAHPSLAGRIWVVRNGFEPVADAGPPPGPAEPLELVHSGSVPPGVAVEPLLRGLDRLAKAEPESLRLRVLGPAEPWRAAAAALGGLDWLWLEGVVTPEAARRAVASASACVLVRPGAGERHVVAAKLVDYLGARRPVLAAIAPDGEMAALGARYGDVRIVAPAEEAFEGAVAILLAEHRAGRLEDPVQPQEPPEALSRRAQSVNLAQILDSVA